MNDAAVDAVFAEARRALHPVDGPLHVLESRVAALEREVAFLSRREALRRIIIDELCVDAELQDAGRQ
jgi:hypothetical protein